jgi:small subunit ribosomal protein S1
LTIDPQIDVVSAASDGPADTMATLLAESEDSRTPQRGEIVEGTVMGWDRDGMLVDIGAKSEGIVPRHELQSLGPDPESKYSGGDAVFVFVVQTESADGQIVLSVDRARGEHGWHTLQERFDSGEIFEANVTGHNKGGLLVNVEGVNAFVPMSQVVGFRPERGQEDVPGGPSLADAVGRSLRLKVIEINRRRNRVILSERAALQEWRMEQKERLIQELHEGDIRRGKITSVRSFGVFVDLGGADGLAHLSELSWERDKSPMDLFHVGDEVNVYITKIDPENKKIALSLRRAQPEQWDSIVDKYKEGQVVVGRITKLVTFGAFARIEGPVEGLVHVSELVDRRIAHPKDVVREGDLLPLKVVRIERDRQRLGLSLKRARDEGEGMGFQFTDGGEVMRVPEDIRNEFEEREGPPPARSEYEDEPREERTAAAEPNAETTAERTSTAESRAPVAVAEPAPAPRREPEPEPMSQLAEQLSAAMQADAAAVIAEEPSIVDEAPMVATEIEQPTVEIEEPSIVDEATAAAAEIEQPTVEAEEPSMVDEATELTAEVEQPAVEIEEPSMVDEATELTAEAEQPSTVDEAADLAAEALQATEAAEEAIAESADQITAG